MIRVQLPDTLLHHLMQGQGKSSQTTQQESEDQHRMSWLTPRQVTPTRGSGCSRVTQPGMLMRKEIGPVRPLDLPPQVQQYHSWTNKPPVGHVADM